MAFTPIDSTEIEVGDPLKKELFDKIKASLDDHETRIADTETSAKKITVFKSLVLNATSSNSMTGLNYYRSDESFNLISCTITIFEKGSLTGALEIDIKKSTTDLNSTSFSTVFTTKPKIDFSTAADYSSSTNQVFDNNQVSIVTGNYLRFDVTELPVSGVLGKFLITLYGEK